MTMFINPHGIEVSAADAKIGGKLRPGFKEILADGEYLHTNILLMDAKPKGEFRKHGLLDERAKGMADAKAFSAARYSGAPMIEAADGENPTQPSMGGQHGSDATATIRSLRYQ